MLVTFRTTFKKFEPGNVGKKVEFFTFACVLKGLSPDGYTFTVEFDDAYLAGLSQEKRGKLAEIMDDYPPPALPHTPLALLSTPGERSVFFDLWAAAHNLTYRCCIVRLPVEGLELGDGKYLAGEAKRGSTVSLDPDPDDIDQDIIMCEVSRYFGAGITELKFDLETLARLEPHEEIWLQTFLEEHRYTGDLPPEFEEEPARPRLTIRDTGLCFGKQPPLLPPPAGEENGDKPRFYRTGERHGRLLKAATHFSDFPGQLPSPAPMEVGEKEDGRPANYSWQRISEFVRPYFAQTPLGTPPFKPVIVIEVEDSQAQAALENTQTSALRAENRALKVIMRRLLLTSRGLDLPAAAEEAHAQAAWFLNAWCED
jgi:hypothetical protein